MRQNIVLQLYDERLLELTPPEGRGPGAADTVLEGGSSQQLEEQLLDTSGTQLHTQLHNTWLASLTIPATALLHSSKVRETVGYCVFLGTSVKSSGRIHPYIKHPSLGKQIA